MTAPTLYDEKGPYRLYKRNRNGIVYQEKLRVCVTHLKPRSSCNSCRSGGAFCIHDKKRSRCRLCKGGAFCIHEKTRSRCRLCKGGEICQHYKRRSQCAICDPVGYISKTSRDRIYKAITRKGSKSTCDFLGCSFDFLRKWIECQFSDGMNWENAGEWHVDHIVPLKLNGGGNTPTNRNHFSNLAPMWGKENVSKNNRFVTVLPLKVLAAREHFLNN